VFRASSEGAIKKPILLATDGSPSAAAATDEAIELAQAFSAPLLIVSVAFHLAVPPYAGYYGYPEIVADLHAAEVERVRRVLRRGEGTTDAGLSCETVAPDGPRLRRSAGSHASASHGRS
jgi:nucleotide-binding universal stress UspA family protein